MVSIIKQYISTTNLLKYAGKIINQITYSPYLQKNKSCYFHHSHFNY